MRNIILTILIIILIVILFVKISYNKKGNWYNYIKERFTSDIILAPKNIIEARKKLNLTVKKTINKGTRGRDGAEGNIGEAGERGEI